jgi:signal-transduction protein with cAMP-binding, CBS, and nucleotidyltransferase domain
MLVPSEAEVDGSYDHVFKMEGGRISGSGETPAAETSPATETESEIEGGFGEEIDVLAAIPMFTGMDRSKLKLLSFASERYQYEPGEVVIKQGDVGDKAYVIVDGEAEVLLETSEGPKKLVTMKKNELFGELALLCEAPRTATIEAGTGLQVMSIEKDVFFTLIAEDPQMSARVTRSVAERLERTTRDLGEALSAGGGS